MKKSILFLGKAQIFRLRRAKINIIGVKGSFLTAVNFSLCIAKSEKITLLPELSKTSKIIKIGSRSSENELFKIPMSPWGATSYVQGLV